VATRGGEQRNENGQSVTTSVQTDGQRELDSVGGGTTPVGVNVGKRLVRFPNLFVNRFAYLFVNGVKRLLNGVVKRLLNSVTNRFVSGVTNGRSDPGTPLDRVGKNGASVVAAPNVFVNGLMTGCGARPG
jgi:hypothetical protein